MWLAEKHNIYTTLKHETYMKSLETASVEEDIEPFAKFIGWLVSEGLKGTPVAKV